MTRPLRWGILGTGNIARQFTIDVSAAHPGSIVAVGSRAPDTARAFAATHHIPIPHATYEAFLADSNVEAVYLSLPNTMHHEWTIKALRAGKHVLCEKPFATSAAQAEEMFDVAAQTGRLLVEAFMYRSHPLTRAVQAAFRTGVIGALQLIRTSFCYRTTRIAGNIRFDPSLAGGALMDIGCYCIDFARLFTDEHPIKTFAVSTNHPSGVDQVAAGTLLYPSGVIASFTCGMSVQSDNAAYLCGSEGYIQIPIPWKPPTQSATYSIVRATPPRMDAPKTSDTHSVPNSGPIQTFTVDAHAHLYAHEADAFAESVLDGKPPTSTPADTISTTKVLDQLRQQLSTINN